MNKLVGFSFFHKIKVEIKDQIYTGTINLYDSISILPSLVFSYLDPLGVARARVGYENCFEKLVFFIEFSRELIFDSRNQEKKPRGKSWISKSATFLVRKMEILIKKMFGIGIG
jgi:hypothetical protein